MAIDIDHIKYVDTISRTVRIPRLQIGAAQLGKSKHMAVHLDHIKYVDLAVSVHVTVENDRVRRNLLATSIIQLHDIRCCNGTAFLLAVCPDEL